MTTTGQLFEEIMATYHSLGIAGKMAGKIVQHPGDLPTALENKVWNFTSSVFITITVSPLTASCVKLHLTANVKDMSVDKYA